MEEIRNAYRILLGKLTGKQPLGRPKNGWVDNNTKFERFTIWS
jgi:hypothetical protein